jgi:hypothetical protein
MGASLAAVVTSAAAALLVGLLGIPSYRSLGGRFGAKTAYHEPLDDLYEDEDGKASVETQSQFKTLIPRIFALLSTLLGLFAAIALAVFVTVGTITSSVTTESWLRVATWILQLIHATAVFIEPAPLKRYSLAIYAAMASLTNLLSCVAALVPSHGAVQTRDLRNKLLIAQVALAFVAMMVFAAIQRRPTLYSEGRPVDGEMTTSLFGRLNYTWGTYLIRRAEKNTTLEYSDLPQLPKWKRAQGLSVRYQQSRKFSSLWRTIMWTFRWAMLKQFIVITIKSFFMFIPQFAMLEILKILESPSTPHAIGIWIWVCVLGSAMVFRSFIENWLYWVV